MIVVIVLCHVPVAPNNFLIQRIEHFNKHVVVSAAAAMATLIIIAAIATIATVVASIVTHTVIHATQLQSHVQVIKVLDGQVQLLRRRYTGVDDATRRRSHRRSMEIHAISPIDSINVHQGVAQLCRVTPQLAQHAQQHLSLLSPHVLDVLHLLVQQVLINLHRSPAATRTSTTSTVMIREPVHVIER